MNAIWINVPQLEALIKLANKTRLGAVQVGTVPRPGYPDQVLDAITFRTLGSEGEDEGILNDDGDAVI